MTDKKDKGSDARMSPQVLDKIKKDAEIHVPKLKKA